uniref:Uncharacterized protein n=1 Tax=Anguilla anguilla TaxID=7936 RepID=A0A0E9UMJ1_ANGAN
MVETRFLFNMCRREKRHFHPFPVASPQRGL